MDIGRLVRQKIWPRLVVNLSPIFSLVRANLTEKGAKSTQALAFYAKTGTEIDMLYAGLIKKSYPMYSNRLHFFQQAEQIPND